MNQGSLAWLAATALRISRRRGGTDPTAADLTARPVALLGGPPGERVSAEQERSLLSLRRDQTHRCSGSSLQRVGVP